MATLRRAGGRATSTSRSIHQDTALEVPFAGNLVDHMVAALGREDPEAVVLPYMLSGRHRQQVARPPGHHRLRLRAAAPAGGLDFTGMFHGVDERVPADSLKFGTRVLRRPADHLLGPPVGVAPNVCLRCDPDLFD